MDKNIWFSKLKEGLLMIHEPMVYELMKQDAEYQRSAEKLDQLEDKYNEIKGHFSQEDAEVIDNFFMAKDSNDLDYASLSFLAGVQTGYWLKELFGKVGGIDAESADN